MKKSHSHFIFLLIAIWLLLPPAAAAQSTGEPVVHAVLFFSPTCPHCHDVINNVLVPMVNEQGEALQILGVDTTQPGGGQLYQTAIEHYQIPPERRGVPTLIVGDVVLVGSLEIPDQFPRLVEEGLAVGGIGWPNIPGLDQQALPPEAQQEPSPTPVTQATASPVSTVTPQTTATRIATPTSTSTPIPAVQAIGNSELPPADPMGFTLAGVITAAMATALGYTGLRILPALKYLLRLDRSSATYTRTWALFILALILAGLGVAAYLAYVEITHVEAVCGPIGECNLVQSSPYARVLGIPIAVLGILNYLAIGVLWAGQGYPDHRLANLSALTLLGLTIFGVLFSIYLTLLELFVIHAVCVWCLSSAVITTLLMLLVVVLITNTTRRPAPLAR